MEKQTYTVPEGCKITSVDLEKGVVVYESEEPKFKSGDFLANDHCITIFKGTEEGYERHFASLRKRNKTLTCFSSDSGWGCVRYFKIATPEEKQLLLDKMHEAGKDWDEEKCEVIDYVWEPKIGEECWYLWAYFSFVWDGGNEDQIRFRENKVFKTESLRRAAEDKIKEVLKEVKHF